MLTIKPLSNEFSVSPQILLEDLPTILQLGYKSIINNRPDGEDSAQIENDKIREKCLELGLEYQYLPVISGQITQQNSQNMSDYMNKMDKPILAFCRTGTRSCLLWLGTALDNTTLKDRIERTSEQGYAIEVSQIPSLIDG